ncbi:leucyl/phenylalanyl-tRNA--protein transferase [Alphaproteobacteria bacterium]|nr:leucyl/phenylalanyl-tRNA--protein transferase [Alphaproteobacteria bacterium]
MNKKIIDPKLIIKLYKKGYFPMADNATSQNINFYKPETRFIIPIEKFHIPRRLLTEFKKKKFNYSINQKFNIVIKNCSENRINGHTWINQTIRDTYIELYKQGIAKSIECYLDNKLVGGLYGIHIGKCFFGESMYSKITNVSKLTLLFLISILNEYKFGLLDSQFYNQHLIQFGAYEILNKEYQQKLNKNIDEVSFFPDFFDYQKSISILQSLTHKS